MADWREWANWLIAIGRRIGATSCVDGEWTVRFEWETLEASGVDAVIAVLIDRFPAIADHTPEMGWKGVSKNYEGRTLYLGFYVEVYHGGRFR